MQYFADLHFHSKYSRATSLEMNLENIEKWAKIKGLQIVGTADFTHPRWFAELKAKLQKQNNGLYKLVQGNTYFIPTTEISCIYSKDNKTRRIHTVVIAPDLETVAKINKTLIDKNFNLYSDGRPILGCDVKEVAKIFLSFNCLVIPAHVWTPWFSLYGSNSGFDSFRECFEEISEQIPAIETGLSSDPEMNWRISELNNKMILSNSDAHSPANLGREANVFEFIELTYGNFSEAIKNNKNLKFTIEFFPEEGKYHWDGHRNCNFSCSPKQTRKYKNICPKCNLPLVIGVLNRVEQLANQKTSANRVPFKKLVPLEQIIAEALDQEVKTKGVQSEYQKLTKNFSEFDILLNVNLNDLDTLPEIREGIKRVREGKIDIEPGYDGVYGKVQVFKPEERKKTKQATLF